MRPCSTNFNVTVNVMKRETVTEDALKRIIQERISNSKELDGDCREVIVNSVSWHGPDEAGNNWDVSLRNPRGCEEFLDAIITDFKQRYNLEEK